MKEILLNKNKGKRSVNVDNKINFELSTTERVLPFSDAIDDVDLYNVYLNEKNKSNKYRLIFTINPLCSNILFNAVTEIVYGEGSDSPIVVPKREPVKNFYKGKTIDVDTLSNYNISPFSTEPLYTTQAIRDTEYSHKDIGPFVYHCGYDIFNNHNIRSLGFNIINKRAKKGDIPESDSFLYEYNYNGSDANDQIKKIADGYFTDTFNTIRDFARDRYGEKVEDYFFHLKNQEGKNSKKRTIHAYQYDDIMSFNESFFTNLTEENGWFGFTNMSSMDLPNYGDISINKCMNNNKSCEHIDMYPDRSLYSFTPKINKNRDNRIEKNWDICLTYPFSKTTDRIERIIRQDGKEEINRYEYKVIGENCGDKYLNAIKIENFTISALANGSERVYLNTSIKHNLNIGDKIQLYYKNGNIFDDKPYKIIPYFINVTGVGTSSGEDMAHWFSVNLEDCYDALINSEGGNESVNNNIILRFCKNVGGVNCQYYFRLFKKIPNFKNADRNIFDDSFIMSDEYIDKYNKTEFNSVLNKLSFSKNIYTDDISQIVFTDDIELTRLHDNLNRPLSEIYLTIIKRNKGYKQWYGYEGIGDEINKEKTANEWINFCKEKYGKETIEYSHAFGKITSGLDLNKECYNSKDYFCNVHYQNNINIDNKYGLYDNTEESLNIPLTSLSIENVICEDKEIDDGITINGGFGENVFVGDLVEFSPTEVKETVLEDIFHRFNTAQRECTNPLYCDIIYDEIARDDYDVSQSPEGTEIFNAVQEYMNKISGENEPSIDANLFPEGYFYKPHYKIKIKEFSDTVKQGNDIQISFILKRRDDDIFNIKTAINYYLEPEDKIYLVNKNDKSIVNAIIKKVEKKVNVSFKADNKISDINEYFIFKPNPERPYYAYLLNDGSGRYLWREILKPSELSNSSDLYDMTFTNGAFYIHNNVNFYLRRQDPHKDYNLYSINSPMAELIVSGNKANVEKYEYVIEENDTTC